MIRIYNKIIRQKQVIQKEIQEHIISEYVKRN